jgi:hypothetical protein
MLLVLLAISAVVYLPANWFGTFPWRESAVREGILLGTSLTPQPWLTLDGILDLVVGVSWGYLLFTQRWSRKEHRLLAQTFSAGILLLVAITIYNFHTGVSWEFWKNERNFGPFANRNHSANLFAIGGIMMLGCAYSAFHRSKLWALLWSAGAVIAVFGVVFSYSRAGVLLLIGGTFLWVTLLAFTTRERMPIAVFGALGISLGTLFLLKGGETLERFKLHSGVTQPLLQDFRWLLYKDVLGMTAVTPWCGIGLGNFGDVFPQFRKASLTEARAPHPDSDWALLHAEMGLVSVLLIGGVSLLVMRHAYPLRHGGNVSNRLAALTSAVVFALHGFANVSGHFLGTAIPALLVASLALSSHRNLPYRPGIARIFRTTAIVIAIAGAATLPMFFGARPVPGRTGVAVLKRAAYQDYAAERWDRVGSGATRGLQMAPLDWEFYYLRALATAFGGGNLTFASDDFRRARFLFPNSWRIAFQQGLVFLQVAPTLAIEPWKHALNRTVDAPPELFRMMLDASDPFPELQEAVRKLASGDLNRVIASIQPFAGKQLDFEISEILKGDPDLSRWNDASKARLLELWAAKGDREKLVEAVQLHPDWKPHIWTVLANHLAANQRFKEACDTALEFLTIPALPQSADPPVVVELMQRFVLNKQDLNVGYQLYRAQKTAGDDANALATLKAMAGSPDCPLYVYYLQAQLLVPMAEWEEAWIALTRYDKRLRSSDR